MSLSPSRNHPIDCGTPEAVPGRRVFSKAGLGSRSYGVFAVPLARQTAGSSADETTFKDKVYETKTAASFVSDYRITATPLAPNYSFSGTATSTAALTLSLGAGFFLGTFAAAGTARVFVTDFQGQVTILSLPVTQETGASAYTFLRYATGSLARHLTGLLDRLSSPPSLEMFATQVPATQTYIRNQSCWVNDIDFTSKGVWNTAGGFGMGGCLLTRRHMVFTAHYGYHPQVGTQIHFVGRGASPGQPEQVAVRTVSNVNAGISRDQCLVRLSEAVPEFITPAEVFPPTAFPSAYTAYESYVPRERAGNQLATNAANITGDGDLCFAGVTVDRNNVARLRLPRVQNRIGWFHYGGTNDYSSYLQYAQVGELGDSGTPCYGIVSGKAVYLGNHTGIASGTVLVRDEPETVAGSSLQEPSPLDEMRDQIAAWGDDDVIETVDLSGFPTYA